MKYFIGIDAGGTKTEAVLCDDKSRVIKRMVSSGCNPMDVGIEQTEKTVCACVKSLISNFDYHISSLYAGIAGMNHISYDMSKTLTENFKIDKVRVDDDRRMVVSGTLGHSEGCGMICGTGCSLSIIKENQPVYQVGGLGYLIDTGGSGYEIGQAGLRNAFRYLDGRGPYTILVELLNQKMGKSLEDGFSEIYAGGRSYIASLASVVFKGCEFGDKVCTSIIEKGSDDLAELTWSAEKYFDDAFPVVMTGGIFFAYPYYADLVQKKSSQKANMILAKAQPVYGAVVEAKYQYGYDSSNVDRDSFNSTYITIPSEKVK